MVVVTRPEDVRTVFSAGADVLHGGAANDVLRPVLGPGSLILLDGEPYLRHRRLLLQALGPEKVAQHAGAIAAATRERVRGFPRDRPFPLLPEAEAIMMHTMLQALMGVPAGEIATIHAAVRELLDAGDSLILFLSRGRHFRGRLDRAIAALDRLVFAVIARRRRGEGRGEDVISLLVGAADALSDVEIRDEIVTLLTAGFEATSAALCWAVAWISESHEIAARVAEGGPYLDAVIKESMRLRPIFTFSIRRVASSFEVAGHTLPAGVEVTPCIYLTHRRADVFPEPERFRPERFLEGKVDPRAWYPFGGGYRRCIGMSLAMQILTVSLQTLYGEVRLERLSRLRGTRRHILIVPERECLVRVR
jgi:cytochrome P450